MDICEIYLLVLALMVLFEVTLFLNVHRLVKVPQHDPVRSGGEVRPQQNPVALVRIAICVSIVIMVALFGYLLSLNGCLG